eukprot:jgi/Psemu1/25610/gm1.25610_g
MVPPPEAYDWSNVYGIAFTFQSDNNPKKAISLNNTYAETVPILAPEMSTLFTSDADAGPRILVSAPVAALKEAFCNVIALDINNIDDIAKGHIAQLINSCPVTFVKPGFQNQGIRNPHDFDSAGREAVQRAQAAGRHNAIAVVEFNISKWRFRHNWKTDDPANYFNGIYTYNNDIPTDANTYAVVPTPHSSGPSVPPNPAILTVPITPVKSEAHPAIQVPSSCVTSSSATTGLLTNKMIHSDVVATPSNTTASIPPVTANLGPLQPVGQISDTPSVKAPRYTWTWTYSPHSELVLFRHICSDSFLCVTSSSPPDHREKSTIVTAPYESTSAQPRFGHHSAPPSEPTNFQWTFNPQSETVVFYRLPKTDPVPPKPSLQLPLFKAIPAYTILASAIPTFAKHSAYPSHFCCAFGRAFSTLYPCTSMRHIFALILGILSSILTDVIHSGSGGVYHTPSSTSLLPLRAPRRGISCFCDSYLDHLHVFCSNHGAGFDQQTTPVYYPVSTIQLTSLIPPPTLAFPTTQSDTCPTYDPLIIPFLKLRLMRRYKHVDFDCPSSTFARLLSGKTSALHVASILQSVFDTTLLRIYASTCPHISIHLISINFGYYVPSTVSVHSHTSPLLVDQGVYVLRPKASPYNPQPWDLTSMTPPHLFLPSSMIYQLSTIPDSSLITTAINI